MLRDLVRKYPIIGLSRDELYKLLGPPLSNPKLDIEDSWYDCGFSLYVQFHFENEFVSAYKIRSLRSRFPPPAGTYSIWFTQNIGENEDYPLGGEKQD